ncbi:conserved hypothetical protein (plasmid) [Polaromonas naphthalenivorans CJ2]|uniref:Uncharacterized protein n=1 Tax=Polaromonas naphthalenivorans (strain CJ2) TaxID=365044 RepID=A1VV15_POLNA|nr:conserved hypothetical protein [Polaromonas naphthalenivorans CJ2]
MELHSNELRDYILRAPKRWTFNGCEMVNNSEACYRWLEQLCRGTLDQRINRRAGLVEKWFPYWRTPTMKSIKRHHDREHIKKYGYFINR